ncbi:membrane protein [Pseudomonas oryzihabitans]|nr:membrane protein [Pseudomonas psychrotolerans]KTT05090.1 membrane protein [Pseudomonas psychrotolerans]KTT53238.1 membrane protein [Pseudomonas psychrotolerans]KTT63920.1 membrane protein [Pseudomonas psychrotolerans]
MTYLLLKYLHILAAIFLFGFGMGSYLYLIATTRSRVPEVIAHVARLVVFFDTWITTPAGFLQLGTGIALVSLMGLPVTSGWVFGSLVLFFAVGALWLPVLWLQGRMLKLARVAVAEGRALGPDFQRAYRLWFWMGVAGFLGMFVILLMMVTKLYPQQVLAFLT